MPDLAPRLSQPAVPGTTRVLMIDNYDSFTFNLVQYLQALGAEVRVERNDALTIDAIEALAPERIVISPGPCTPNEAGVSVELIERLGARVPIILTSRADSVRTRLASIALARIVAHTKAPVAAA